MPVRNPDSLKKVMGWVTVEVERGEEISGHIHFCDGLWQIRGDLRETFPTTVYDIVATGTGSWTVQDTARRRHKGLVTCKRNKQQ